MGWLPIDAQFDGGVIYVVYLPVVSMVFKWSVMICVFPFFIFSNMPSTYLFHKVRPTSLGADGIAFSSRSSIKKITHYGRQGVPHSKTLDLEVEFSLGFQREAAVYTFSHSADDDR